MEQAYLYLNKDRHFFQGVSFKSLLCFFFFFVFFFKFSFCLYRLKHYIILECVLYLPKIWALANYSAGTGPAKTVHVMQYFQMTLNMGSFNQLMPKIANIFVLGLRTSTMDIKWSEENQLLNLPYGILILSLNPYQCQV